MKTYDYYITTYGYQTLRRFPRDEQLGQRWTGLVWTDQCGNRTLCINAKDKLITKAEAEMRFPDAFKRTEVTA